MIEDFFHLPPVPLAPVVHLEQRISPQIFKKIWNSPNGILRGLGETDSWKKPEVEKSRDTVPLTVYVIVPVYRFVNRTNQDIIPLLLLIP